MEASPVCRICLSTEASQDISDLKFQQSDKTGSEIVLFCLSIQVQNNLNISTKLCLKCFRKIKSFFKFKLLALKNDAYLKSLESTFHIKSEAFLDEDLKTEEQSLHDSDNNECPLSAEIKQEPITYEDDPADCTSDDELLSEIKKIKYEFIPEAIEIKENKKVKPKTKKGKICKNIKLKTHICTECGKSVKQLKEHLLRHVRHRDPSARLPCPLCDKTFSSYDARSKHKYSTHWSRKKSCPICNKLVVHLRSHTRYMHNSSKLRYECLQCKKRFFSSSRLNAHASCHTKDRPHTCDVCNKTFRLLGQVNSHKRNVHDKKTRMCHFCSKSFASEYFLARHLRVHTKETPFKCKKYDTAFNNPATLKNHMYVHSKKQPFVCKICSKRFTCPRYLTNHMLTHTREKRYPCSYCDMKFHRSDHVRQHEAAVHKIKNRSLLM